MSSKEQLLSDLKQDDFQASAYLESKLQPVINPAKFRDLGVEDLVSIRDQVRSQRRFLEQVDKEIEEKRAATAKRDKFQEKFTYQNLKVYFFYTATKEYLVALCVSSNIFYKLQIRNSIIKNQENVFFISSLSLTKDARLTIRTNQKNPFLGTRKDADRKPPYPSGPEASPGHPRQTQ